MVKGGDVVLREGKLVDEDVSGKTLYFTIDETEIEEAKENQREVINRICNRRSFRAEHLKVDECFIQSY